MTTRQLEGNQGATSVDEQTHSCSTSGILSSTAGDVGDVSLDNLIVTIKLCKNSDSAPRSSKTCVINFHLHWHCLGVSEDSIVRLQVVFFQDFLGVVNLDIELTSMKPEADPSGREESQLVDHARVTGSPRES